MVHPTEVTTILMQRIRDGVYITDTTTPTMPTLDQLNDEFFGGDGAGPKPGRTAYAPLIAAGLVEARQGRNGGHFLIAPQPEPIDAALKTLSAELRTLAETLETVRNRGFYIIEFQHVATGQRFGRALHPSRLAAEESALGILVHLGEARDDAARTVVIAGATIVDVSAAGYGVQISGYTLGGDTFDIHGRAS